MRLQALFRFLLLCVCASAVWAAAPQATVTVLEGSGVLTRGTTRYALSEGVHLQPADIIETASDSLALVEFSEAGIIALAANSRLLVLPTSSKVQGVHLFLLQGQAKIRTGVRPHRVTTPLSVVTSREATIVLGGGNAETALFVEQGEASVEDVVSGRRRVAGTPVRNGEFYVRQSGHPGQVSLRPPTEFISGLPRLFLEKLPSRSGQLRDVEVELKKARDIAYADVEPWLKTNIHVRRVLVPRWRTMARNVDFRKSLVANLKHHPEWDRILFPEKYEELARQAREAKR